MVGPRRPPGRVAAELRIYRATIEHAIDHGPNALRKAVLQQFVVEVRIESRRVVWPTFRLPLAGVRELSQMVRLEGIEPPALRSGAAPTVVQDRPQGLSVCRVVFGSRGRCPRGDTVCGAIARNP